MWLFRYLRRGSNFLMNHLFQHWCRKTFFSQYVIKLKYICWIIHNIINLKSLKYWTWKSHFYYFSARLTREQQLITTILAQIVVKNTRWMQVWYNKNYSNFVSYIHCTSYIIFTTFSVADSFQEHQSFVKECERILVEVLSLTRAPGWERKWGRNWDGRKRKPFYNHLRDICNENDSNSS